MPIRRSYHYHCNQANLGDGIYLSNQCDIHGVTVGAYAERPYMVDSDSTSFLSLGDRPTYKPNSASLPCEIIGGLHGYTRLVSVSGAITRDDYFIQANAVLTLTIPAISTMPRKIIVIENINSFSGSNIVSIVPTGANTIDGATRIDLDPGAKIMLYLDPAGLGIARVISNTPRIIVLIHDMAPASYTTTSGSYVTMRTSASYWFSGRPGMMLFSSVCRDDRGGVDEYWVMDFAFRFGAGSDFHLSKASGTFHDERRAASGSVYCTPSPGNQTVDLRWKRGSGAGTIKIDTWDYIQLKFMEL